MLLVFIKTVCFPAGLTTSNALLKSACRPVETGPRIMMVRVWSQFSVVTKVGLIADIVF